MTEQQLQSNPNSTTLVMGEGGSGKSSLLATVAEFVWETYKKWSGYYLIDGGGVPTQVSALQRLGIIKLWRMRTRSGDGLILETITRASMGWWPKRINPYTGETEPSVELVSPTTEVIEISCPCGTVAQTVHHPAQIRQQGTCSACGKPVNSQTWIQQRRFTITPGFEQRGAVLFDGISSAGDWSLEDLSMRKLGGEETRLGGRVRSGNMEFGENNRAQVGFAQTRCLQWLQNGAAIPGLVVPAVWTSLVADGRDDGLPIKGPKLPGQAKTTAAPQAVGNLLEAVAEKNDQGDPVRRLYIKAFVDKENFRHLLKPRAYPALLPPYLEDLDTDDAAQPRFINFNLGKFFQLMEAARVQNETMITAAHPDAPGIASSVEEFGATLPMAPVGTPATPQTGPRPAGVPKAVPKAGGVKAVAPKSAPVQVSGPQSLAMEPATPAVLTTTPVEVAQPVMVNPVAQPTAPAPTRPSPPPPGARPPARGPIAAPAGRRPVPVVKPGGGQ